MEKELKGTTIMWLAVDQDGWGKMFKYCPTRHKNMWVGTGECAPKLLIQNAKTSGMTWEDEPRRVWVDFVVTNFKNIEQ